MEIADTVIASRNYRITQLTSYIAVSCCASKLARKVFISDCAKVVLHTLSFIVPPCPLVGVAVHSKQTSSVLLHATVAASNRMIAIMRD